MIFTNPLPSPEELNTFYQGFLYKKPNPSQLSRRIRSKKKEIEELFELKGPASTDLRFLDYGGGTGVAYKAAKDLGFECFFCDIDQSAVQFVRDEFGLDEPHSLSSVTALPAQFDYILCDNVIEHVIDPLDLMRSLVGVLKPGGMLIVKTPYAGATEHYFSPRTLRNYLRTVVRCNSWKEAFRMLTTARTWYCDPPRHLYSFSKQGMRALCQRIGLSEGEVQLGHYRTPFLANTLTQWFLKRPPNLRALVKRIVLFPGVIAELVFKTFQWLGLGIGVLSPGGLFVRVTKRQSASS